MKYRSRSTVANSTYVKTYFSRVLECNLDIVRMKPNYFLVVKSGWFMVNSRQIEIISEVARHENSICVSMRDNDLLYEEIKAEIPRYNYHIIGELW